MFSRSGRIESIEGDALTTEIGTVVLENPVMLASGTAGHGMELSSSIDLSSLGALVVKSLAPYEWQGNNSPRLHETPSGMINSIGLQGPGLQYWMEETLPKLKSEKVNVVLSIWGRTLADYVVAAEMCSNLPEEVVAVELNISCPNIENRGEMFSHSTESTRSVIEATESITKPRWVKLSPNVTNLVEIAASAKEAGAEAVTLINTLMGMVIDIDERKPLLGGGGGGLSGPAIRPVAIRSVYEVRNALPDFPIVGVGGVASFEHVLEFMMAGASAVQIGTANFANPKISETVIKNLHKWCKDNGVQNLKEIIGIAQRS